MAAEQADHPHWGSFRGLPGIQPSPVWSLPGCPLPLSSGDSSAQLRVSLLQLTAVSISPHSQESPWLHCLKSATCHGHSVNRPLGLGGCGCLLRSVALPGCTCQELGLPVRTGLKQQGTQMCVQMGTGHQKCGPAWGGAARARGPTPEPILLALPASSFTILPRCFNSESYCFTLEVRSIHGSDLFHDVSFCFRS